MDVKVLSSKSSVEKNEKFDVAVVGAGVIGLSSAYHVKSDNPDLNIVVLDQAAAAGQGDTAKSAGAFRNVFTSDVNRLLSDTSIDFYVHVQKDLGYNLDLKYAGYLWLLSDEQLGRLENTVDSMRSEGIQLRIWEKRDLKDMIGEINLDIGKNDEEARIIGAPNIVKGLQGIKCGTVSPDLIAGYYEHEFRKIGGSIRYNMRVDSLLLKPATELDIPGEPLIWQSKKIVGVKTSVGNLMANRVIVAAGCRANQLLDPLGIDARFKPKKRQIFSVRGSKVEALLNTKGFNEYDILPFTIMPHAGVFIRPEPAERGFWVGAADELGRAFKFEEDPQAERDYYTYSMYPVLSKYLPQFKDVSPTNMWAGLYDVNTLDAIPYLFEEEGMIAISGLSGSGIMKADAVGRMVAALYSGKEYAELYGGKKIEVARLGFQKRDVGVERFVL
jgi:FAD-dependent oxidoreductase domain-containing protein 1